MPIIHFGLGFSERRLPLATQPRIGEQFVDHQGLLQWLEATYGLHPVKERLEVLRIERFRQLLIAFAARDATAFFRSGLEADPLATAEDMLGRRDELLAAGYDLRAVPPSDCPDRLACLHRLESQLQSESAEHPMPAGPADRLCDLLDELRPGGHAPLWIRLHEPLGLLDPASRRLLKRLHETGDFVQYLPPPPSPRLATDLGKWQAAIHLPVFDAEADYVARADEAPSADFVQRWQDSGQLIPDSWTVDMDRPAVELDESRLSKDGSLLILRAKRETHLSAYLAALIRMNPDWKPAILQARKRQTLDNGMRMEGLPSMGIPSASLARPSLQVLKLVTSFLWEPTDLRKLLEFLNLVVKPLERTLAYRLAIALSESPGLYSEEWFRAVSRYFEQELPVLAEHDPTIVAEQVQAQYDFWFRRTRYPLEGRAPKAEVRKLFTTLVNWVRERSDQNEDDSSGLLTLAAQAARAVELLDQRQEDELTALEVERLVRTVYEPAPAQFQARELGACPVAFHPAAIHGPVEELVWWDFTSQEADYFFSRWYRHELDYLEQADIRLLGPDQKNERQVWSRSRPLLFCRNRLILCYSDRVDGEERAAHPLYGELQALFGDAIAEITLDLDGESDIDMADWELPAFSELDLKPLSAPRKHVLLNDPDRLRRRERESPTALEQLVYFPHLYVLRHGARLQAGRQLNLELGPRLFGKLAHRFIEGILQEDRPLAAWTREEVHSWIVEQEPELLRREGGLLLEYGGEPERAQFRRRLEVAAWTLISSLRDNGWQRIKTEENLQGAWADCTLAGRADLIGQRADGSLLLVDLKWRGKTHYSNLIRNREDLQLSLYAHLMQERDAAQVHTAYYLLNEARFLSRTHAGFDTAEAIEPEANDQHIRDRMLEQLENTYAWRQQQIKDGLLEIRCSETAAELERAYADEDLSRMLEMRDGDAPYDDYQALIGLIR